MLLGVTEQRIAVGLDGVQRQILLSAQREEGDERAAEDRENKQLDPFIAARNGFSEPAL